ncbi:MAG TPA: type II toxin-antitoxin system HicA family toxin [Mycobacteriales bacterium]|jgi:predicted RNA binding protein YcfA (HicA-like mRNA interferase family)
MTPREVCRRIERRGGRYVEARGSHRRYRVGYGAGGTCVTTVPMHRRDLKPGTLRAIERDLEPAFGERWLRR